MHQRIEESSSNGVKHNDNHNDNHKPNHSASTSTSSTSTSTSSETTTHSRIQAWLVVVFVYRLPVVLRLASCMCVVAGFWLSGRLLHTHEECDMTYSRRQFLPLSMNNNNNMNNNVTSQNGNNTSQSPSPYRLWKFIDQRDPRYRRFVSSSNSDRDRDKPALMMGTDWCDGGDRDKKSGKNTSTVAVLYIPGHGGSYEQSRSLGAHGLQLTGARNVLQERRVVSALQRNEWSGATSTNTSTNTSTDIDNFIFDVYAVDFGEEGGGLHGDLILEQGLFVGQAVQKLVQDCQLQDIVLVGHSMGGFAARLASILVPETRPHIRNIVTLATPHAGAWNPSLFHIHEHMKMMTSTSTSTSTVDTDSGDDNDNKNSNTVQQNTALISIAGGLRDEMILPEACHVNAAGAMTIMVTDMMKETSAGRAPDLGMDHRAIVWCHNFLLSMRTVIFTLVETDRHHLSATDRIDAVRESLSMHSNYDFLSAAGQLRITFRRLYGTARAILMESALLSNVELLITLYAYIGAWRCIVAGTSWAPVVSMLLPVLVSVHCRLFIESSTVPWHSIVLLSYAADSIFLLLRMTLRLSMRGIWLAGRVKAGVLQCLILLFVVTACGSQLVYAIVTFAGKRQSELLDGRSLFALASFLFSPVLALALTAGLSKQSVADPTFDRYVHHVTWTLPLVPLILAGEVYYIFVRGKASSMSGAALIWKVAPVAFRLILGYLDVTNPVRGEKVGCATFIVLQVVRVFLVLVASPLIFKSGGSVYIGHALVALSGVETVETIVRLLARTKSVEKEE